MAQQLKVVLAMIMLCSPRDRSIEVLSHREEVVKKSDIHVSL
jgi:hypothetical protein